MNNTVPIRRKARSIRFNLPERIGTLSKGVHWFFYEKDRSRWFENDESGYGRRCCPVGTLRAILPSATEVMQFDEAGNLLD